MNKLILRIIGFFRPFWKSLGADPGQLELILSTKLMMDDRRPNTYHVAKPRKKEVKGSTIGTMVMMGLMGVIMLVFLAMFSHNPLTGFTLYFLFFIMMLAMTLISDFTSVLIDVRDNYIILPRPVNDRTMLLSRLLHIGIHLGKLVIPMTLPGIIYEGIRQGILAALVFFFLAVSATIMTIFLVNLVYLLILKITTPTRFNEIINYIQIGFIIFIFGFYQLFSRVFESAFLQHLDITQYHWIYYTPVFWLAATWEALIGHVFRWPYIISAILSVLTPLFSIWLVIRVLAPSFNRKLTEINAADAGGGKKTGSKVEIKKTGIPGALARIVTRDKIQRAGFILGWKVTARDRNFKLKVYPSFGYLVIMVVVFAMDKGGSLAKISLSEKSPLLIILIYITSFVLLSALTFLKSSDKHNAAWIYYVTPMQSPGKLMLGTLKMVMAKYFLPFYAIVAIIALALKGPSFLPDLVLGFLNVVLIGVLLAFVYFKNLPFSQEWRIDQNAGRFLKSLMVMLGVFLLGFLHYMIAANTVVVLIMTLLVFIADWLLLDAFGRLRWEQLDE